MLRCRVRTPRAPERRRGWILIEFFREGLLVTAVSAVLAVVLWTLGQDSFTASSSRAVQIDPVFGLWIDGQDDLWTLQQNTGLTRWNEITGQSISVSSFGRGQSSATTIAMDHSLTVLATHVDGPTVELRWNGDMIHVAPQPSALGPLHDVDAGLGGTLAAAVSHSGRLTVWSIAEGVVSEPRHWELNRSLESVAFSPDGTQAALVTEGTDLMVFDFEAGRPILLNEAAHGHRVSQLCWLPCGTRVATVGMDKHVRVWDGRSGELQWEQTADITDPSTIAASACGRWIATGGFAGRIRLWNATTGELVREFGDHRRSVRALRFLPGADQILSGGLDGQVAAWNAADGTLIRKYIR
jgi:WD40 repeat protein